MADWKNKKVIIIGLGKSGIAAAEFLVSQKSNVWAIDSKSESGLRKISSMLEAKGIKVLIGQESLPSEAFDLAVLSPGVSMNAPMTLELKARNIPCIGELELGYQAADCLNIAITGTNGKTTVTQLISSVLHSGQRKTEVAGNIGVPFTSIIGKPKA